VHLVTSWPVRLAVTVGLLVGIALIIDWGAVADRLERGEWLWFAAAVAVDLLALVVGARRWWRILVKANVTSSWPVALRAYGIGALANNVLPTGFGGDAARLVAVARPGAVLARAATSVVVDRVTALACLVGLAWVVLPLGAGEVPGSLVLMLAVVSIGGTLALLAGVGMARSARMRALAPRKLRPWLSEIAVPLRPIARDRALLIRIGVLGLVYQGLAVAAVAFSARAIGVDLPYPIAAVAALLAIGLTVLPISIAGFGVREGGYVVVLAEAGVSATDAALISLLATAAIAIASLPWAATMFRRRAVAAAKATSEPPDMVWKGEPTDS
jgi:glycosyltransferase 2 family protein